MRLFLKEGNSIPAESNSVKETKVHRWASSVKSRGLDSKSLEWLGLFSLPCQKNLLATTSDKQEIEPVGE